MLKLSEISISGFKSINKNGQLIRFNDINVLIGANGAGKSNLVSFFSMLNYMNTGGLQNWIAKSNFANSVLFLGSKNTTRIEATLRFESDEYFDKYKFVLSHAAGDRLIINEESIEYGRTDTPNSNFKIFDFGVKESNLAQRFDNIKENQPAIIVSSILKGCRVYQFHDTSSTSNVRNQSYIEDGRYLRSDGGNLSAFLYMISNKYPKYYDRIVRHLQSVIPQFSKFVLKPSLQNDKYINLDWKGYDPDYTLGPHQISDGSLRFMCLTALLLQPKELLPNVIIIDEPELGLHPSAIAKLAGMIKIASTRSQIILATQSSTLVDEFELDDILVVERDPTDGSSIYSKLSPDSLSGWLEEYTLSELWEKNVIGGQPQKAL